MIASAPLVEPAYCWIPPYSYTLGPEVAELCDRVGFTPDPEQALALDAIFAVGANGKSVCFEGAVIGPRQNIKTGLFKQCVLGWLYLCDVGVVTWTAHEFSTSQESHRDLAELVEGSDFLTRRLKAVHWGNGDEAIELMSGARVKFKARTKVGGRGLSGEKIVFDEGFALQPSHLGSLMPLVAVQPDPQLLYGSSAGMVTSGPLRAIRDRGRPGGDPRLAYIEFCDDLGGDCEAGKDCSHKFGVAVGCRMDDRRRWHRANPQLGRRLQIETMEGFRRSMPPAEFGREELGWWDEDPLVADVFPEGTWAARTDAESAVAGPVSLAVEVAQDRSWSCVGAAGRREDGLLHVQVAENYPGTDWVPRKLKDLGADEVAIQPNSPAGSLVPAIEAQGIKVHKLSGVDYAAACGQFYDWVRDAGLRHLVQGELDTAVKGAEKRETPEGAWVLDRKGDVDISPLVAVVLAAHLASMERVSVYEERGVRFL